MPLPRFRPSAPAPGDLVGGLTVALVLIPQSIAYAALAGMPPVHGLYAAAIAPILGSLVGSSPYLQTGPTAVTSLLVLGSLAPLGELSTSGYVAHAAVLAVLVGVFRLSLGLIRGGFVAYLMSHPVIAGFTPAVAAIITASQIPGLIGMTGAGGNPIVAAGRALADPGGWSVPALLLGLAVVAMVLVAKRIHPLIPGALLATVAALVLARQSDLAVPVVGDLPSGLPELTLDLPWSAVPTLALPAAVIALIGFAEAASISRRYASADRSSWDPDREFVGQGLANLGAGFFGGFPVGGSFSRSALNRLSGARTRWSGLVTGIVVLATMPFLAVLSDVPRTVLAGLVIASVLGLLTPAPLVELWRYSRPQFAIALATLVTCLATAPSVQWGVIVGVVLALALHLWRELSLDVELWIDGGDLHVRPQGVLYFGSAPGLETRILAELATHPRLTRVRIHLQRLGRVDVSGALVLRDICRDLARVGVPVSISGVQPQCRRLLDRVLDGEGVDYTHDVRPAPPS